MKKIAFIASGHAGCTMPLIKAFINKGYAVDYYILCNKIIRDIEATDCNYISHKRGIEEIHSRNWPKFYSEYLNSSNFKIYSISTYRPFEKNIILNKLIGFFRTVQIKKTCKFINEQGYCFVNFVGRYKVSDIIRYSKFIKSKYIVSLHEVCNHQNPDFEHPNNVLKYLFEKRIPIILYSDKSLRDIKQYKGAENGVFIRQNYGKFESFAIFKGRKQLVLPENYVLFIGRLTPYKGLSLFFEATKEMANNGMHLVVAGNGYDETLDEIKKSVNYTVVNRYLTDEDFAELVERCSFVVCPYTSISQSGIPQTVFVFNKPIIATDLNGFRDIIANNMNGLLFPKNDIAALRKCIMNIYNNKFLLNRLSEGVKNFDTLFPAYSWNNISDKYIADFIDNKHEDL